MEKFSVQTYDEFRRVDEFITNLRVKLTGYMDRNYPGLLEVSGTSPLIEVSYDGGICFEIRMNLTDSTRLLLNMTSAELKSPIVQKGIDKIISRTPQEKEEDEIGLGIEDLDIPSNHEFRSYMTVNNHLEDFANNIHYLINKGDMETLTSFRLPEDIGKMNMKWGSMLNKSESLEYLVINLENEKKSRSVYVDIFHILNTHTEIDVIKDGLFILGHYDDEDNTIQETKKDIKSKELNQKLFSINHRLDILHDTVSKKFEELLNDQKVIYLNINDKLEKLNKTLDRLFDEVL